MLSTTKVIDFFSSPTDMASFRQNYIAFLKVFLLESDIHLNLEYEKNRNLADTSVIYGMV